MPRLSANLDILLPERPFLDRLAAARATGFEAVALPLSCDHAPADIAARLRTDTNPSGEIDHSALFARREAQGHAGWVSGAYRPRGRTADGLGWIAQP